jgi:hypothetical protein
MQRFTQPTTTDITAAKVLHDDLSLEVFVSRIVDMAARDLAGYGRTM